MEWIFAKCSIWSLNYIYNLPIYKALGDEITLVVQFLKTNKPTLVE